MNNLDNRRQALKRIAGSLLSLAVARPQGAPLEIAGRPVEIALSSVSPQTVRITVQPIENGKPLPVLLDGALVKEDWGPPVARLRSFTAPRGVKCGDLSVKIAGSPLNIRVEAKGGKLVQELKIDASGKLSFQLGEGPLLGLGQGGPQFDRRGSTDRMGNGQGAYKLATHGARVPIQFAIGASGWAMFIHAPMGAFDLTGKEAQLQPSNPQAALPVDVFVIAANTPAATMREYAKITGFPEMPPLWSLGYQQSHRTLERPKRSWGKPGCSAKRSCLATP